MKNLLKNKKFYFGTVAAVAVAAGLYFAIPAMTTTNDEQTNTAESSKTEIDKSTVMQNEPTSPAVNVQPSEGGIKVPAVIIQPTEESDQNPTNTNTEKVVEDQI